MKWHEGVEVKLPDLVQEEVAQLEKLIRTATLKLNSIKREHQLGIFCCIDSENSNGWNHNGNCKNWVLPY